MKPREAERNPKIDAYIETAGKWGEELEKLRTILLGCGLTEEFKWGQPCYTFEEANVVILYALKEACAVSFLKGALLKDAHGLLIVPGPNTQSGRWMKFTDAREIADKKTILRDYVHEAVEVQKAGLEVTYKQTSEFAVPEELQSKLDKVPAFKTAFDALTPGRQRGYLIHFAAPKQSRTRTARIEKWTPRILAGKGMHDY